MKFSDNIAEGMSSLHIWK